jgi:hypothetical protein
MDGWMDGNTPLVGLNIYRFGACSYRGGRLLIFSCFLLHIPTPWAVGGHVLERCFPLSSHSYHSLTASLFSFSFNKFIMDGFMKNYD